MIYVLMAMFGGGEYDWEDITKTDYEWEDIFEYIKGMFGNNFEIKINDIYNAILELATIDIEKSINILLEENKKINKEEKEILLEIKENVFEHFENYCNCLDTHITFIGNDKEKEVLNKYLSKEIEEINKKIGFTYVENLE